MQEHTKSTCTRSNLRSTQCHLAMLCAVPLTLMLTAGHAAGQTRTWRNAVNGTFSTGSNWVGSVAPGASNPALFGLNANINPFTVLFTTNATTAGLTVSNQSPVFNLAGFAYNITGDTLIGGSNAPILTMTNGTIDMRAGGGRLYVGQNLGQTGTLIVSGGSINGIRNIGYRGTGILELRNGATGFVGVDEPLVIGDFAGSIGTLTVTGAATSLTQTQSYTYIGNVGTGTLNILNGANVSSQEARVAFAGGTGTILVDSGSDWNIVGQFSLGSSNNATSVGTLTVRGSGSTVIANSLVTYQGGRGDINIENGGRLELLGGVHTWDNGTRQNWRVSGQGSTLFIGSSCRLSNDTNTQATFTVDSGADVTANWFALTDYSPTAQAEFTLAGAGSSFTSSEFNAFTGTSDIRLFDASEMSVGYMTIGCCNYGASGEVTISGTDTVLRVAHDFSMTGTSNGLINVEQGAKIIGDEPDQSMFFYFGGSGNSTLHIDGIGSEVRVKNQLRLGWWDGTSNTEVHITNGASATVGTLTLLGGGTSTSDVTVSGSSLLSSLDWIQVYTGCTLNVINGGGVETLSGVDIRGSQLRPSEVVIGAGSYIFASFIGVGNDLPVYDNGIITIDGGTVYTSDHMPIRDNGILRGYGNFEGNVSVNGLVQPGLPVGTLNVTNINFNSQRQPRLDIQIGGDVVDTEYDRLAVANQATLGGTLSLSLTNGFAPSVGQTFDIVTAGTINGEFTSISGTDLGAGKAFVPQYLPNIVQLIVDGVASVNITQPTLNVVEGYSETLTASASYVISQAQNVTSSVTWTSDNPEIAIVSADGKVTGIGGGTTTIRASYAGFQDTVEITVIDLPRHQDAIPGLLTTILDTAILDFDHLTPFLTTVKSSIQFDGGEANMLSGRSTWYGAKFTARLNITTAGEYSFVGGADDAVTIWIDGKPIAYGRVFQVRPAGTVTLEPGEHEIRVDYAQQDNEGSWMGVDWWGPGIARQRITSEFLVGGLATLEFFDTPQYPFGNAVPDFDQFRGCLNSVTPNLNFPSYPGGYDGGMLRHDADLAIPESGEYTFTVNVDDGAKVWLDGTEVLNAWSPWGFGVDHTFTRTLDRGIIPIRIDFTQHQGHYGGLVLSIEGPSISKQPVASAAFSHGGTPAPVCIGDFNQDGGVDGSDVDRFFEEWGAGNASADVNQDGGVDGSDVELFFQRWEQGC